MNSIRRSKLNLPHILHIISIIIIFEGIFMIPMLLISWFNHEQVFVQLTNSVLVTIGFGSLLYFFTLKGKHSEPAKRESLFVATFGWIFLAFFGCLPFFMSQYIPGFIDCFFESMSGFTTTGSSILTDIEALPKSLLFWRSETHWIGGMGIIVLVVAIMPFLKINSMQLFSSEASVVVEEKISTKIRYVARNIWIIYVGLTVIETILLCVGGMSLFDSVCHSFATVATGGFSTKNTSVADFSPYIQYVIMVFMLLSGINFALHVLAFNGNYKTALKNQELRLYLKIIVLVGFAITFILYFTNEITFERSFRDAFFQVISVLTATGFATDDYLLWPNQGIMLIVLLMLIGACAGSTGGGVKVIRHYINGQNIKRILKSILHPNAVIQIRYNNQVLSTQQVSSISNFIIIYYGIVVLGTIAMTGLGSDWATSFGSIVTTMGGIGPGFGTVGPASNFAMLPEASKVLLSFTMLLGRLEIFSVLTLFTSWFWKT